jgi:hypothetical protein
VKAALWWVLVACLAAGGLYGYHSLYEHAVAHEWIRAAFSFIAMIGWWSMAAVVGIHRAYR